MGHKYNPSEFESKWQEKWFSDLFYEGKDLLEEKKKYYIWRYYAYGSY